MSIPARNRYIKRRCRCCQPKMYIPYIRDFMRIVRNVYVGPAKRYGNKRSATTTTCEREKNFIAVYQATDKQVYGHAKIFKSSIKFNSVCVLCNTYRKQHQSSKTRTHNILGTKTHIHTNIEIETMSSMLAEETRTCSATYRQRRDYVCMG